jgi:hypothetical protein
MTLLAVPWLHLQYNAPLLICLSVREILHEIDPLLTNADLDGIIEEVDEDGSGTLDFDGQFNDLRTVRRETANISFATI